MRGYDSFDGAKLLVAMIGASNPMRLGGIVMSAPIATVFGASGGMGHSLVKELIEVGYQVRAVARNAQRMQE
jgi:hypothetical protein